MATLLNDDQLSWICSSLTLQSDRKGFFQTFAENVLSTGGNNWLAEFSKCKIDRDRILCCLNHRKVRDVVQCTLENVQKMFRSKSGRFAKEKREEAEHNLSKNRLTQAALSANIGVARAPFPGVDSNVDDGLTLPLCLWTRTKVMIAQEDYPSALEDVQLALKYKLPDNLKLEAYVTMSECYLKLGEKEKAKISWTIVSKMAELFGNLEIHNTAANVLDNMENVVLPVKKNEITEASELYDGESKALLGTSSAVSMRRSKDKGRYMVANCSLPVGAIVASEEPYSSVLKFEKHSNHCLNCYTRLTRVIPCSTCSGVAYCSSLCATEGHVYHQWECPFVELMIGSGMSLSSALSLRMVTQFPVEHFLELFSAVQKNDEHPHLKVYNLETHSKSREPKDFVYRTLMALLQLQILRVGDYFKNYGSTGFDDLTDAEMTVGCMLLRHLQLTQYNAHEIYESVVQKNVENWTVSDSKMNYVGLGLYTSSDYFNHECQPTLARYFEGKKLVLRLERPIKLGEEVSENYGPSVLSKSAKERSKLLNARYHFVCSCVACAENWPLLKDIPPTTYYFRCGQNQCKATFKYEPAQKLTDWTCSVCNHVNNLDDQLALMEIYKEDMKEGLRFLTERKTAEAEVSLSKFIESSSRLIAPPNYDQMIAMESLRNCWSSHSNFFVV